MSALPSISIGQHSELGPKQTNDDSYGVLIPDSDDLLETKGIAMAIADGVSSSEAAKEASETCIKSFLMDYYCTHESWSVKTSVNRVLGSINSWLYGQSQSRYLSDCAMVSTFSGMILKSGIAYLFHVGDSRIYLYRDGEISPLTRDHRMRLAKRREYLARAMGNDFNVEIDYRNMTVNADDIFIFTTDGVHDFIRGAEMAALVGESPDDLDAAAGRITAAALKNGSDDNLTCQIIRVSDPGMLDPATHYRRLQQLPFPPELAAGNILDGYSIIRELHVSKRSQIYLAVDAESDDVVAIKTPSVYFDDDPLYIELFTREEWVGSRISSPHVLRVLKPHRKRRFLYTVTEYVEGSTLRQWMHDNPAPGLHEVRDIIGQIAKGLRAFHRKEMIHQDLKPENIIIDRDGTVKIIDFGSVRVAGLDELQRPGELQGALGSVDYAAPEYQTGAPASSQADIFSLGVIAYEMLTGKLPYGKGFSDLKSVNRLFLTPVSEHRDDIPPWINGTLAKAVDKNISQRYAVLSHFISDLKKPNPAFVKARSIPLMERNPAAFWKGLALVMLLVNLMLLLRIW